MVLLWISFHIIVILVFFLNFASVSRIGPYLHCSCQNITGTFPHTADSPCSEYGICTGDKLEMPRCFVSKYEMGCISQHGCLFYSDLGFLANKTFMKCCRDDLFCNRHIDKTDFEEHEEFYKLYLETLGNQTKRDLSTTAASLVKTSSPDEKLPEEEITLIILIPSIILILAFVWIVRKKCKSKTRALGRSLSEHEHLNQNNPREVSVQSNSGSGMGNMLLCEKTLVWQINLGEAIGDGAFGVVRRGKWNGQDVAVKVMDSSEQESWDQEKDLYMTKMLSHKNILGFIGADTKDCSYSTERWLVFEYHSNGSLYDYLQEHVLQIPTMLTILTSIVDGLHHLHLEIRGTAASKPSIAHRDIKTKNILVKRDETCCIADFGLAHKHQPKNLQEDYPPSNPRAGTSRYQSPEILDGTLNTGRFEAFRKVDIYAFGLCVWEVCHQTQIFDNVEEYQLPYYNDVPSNPSQADMKIAVCDQKKRPEFPKYWSNVWIMQSMKRLIKECLFAEPFARLSILRIRMNLHKCVKRLESEDETKKLKSDDESCYDTYC